MALLHRTRPFVDRFIDTVFPPRCGACGAAVEKQGTLCAECWSAISFIAPPLCACCGFPFESELDEGALCGKCIKKAPPYDALRVAFRYEEGSRRQILGMKYYDRTVMVPTFGKWLAQAGKEFTGKADVIMPVPLHPRRLLRRKYNQAGLLAYALAQEVKLPVLPDGLVRKRYTVPQASLPRKERLRNLSGVFEVNPRCREHLQGLNVLLVDDVVTTGATIEACCKALRKAKAEKIYVLALARTVV